MKYIKPVILCCYDIDMSIIAATLTRVTSEGVDDTKAKFGDGLEVGDSNKKPTSTKGTSWNLWEDEEENSFY